MQLRTITVTRTTTQTVTFDTTLGDVVALDRARHMFDCGEGGVSEVDEIVNTTDLPIEETYPGINDETGRFSLPEDL